MCPIPLPQWCSTFLNITFSHIPSSFKNLLLSSFPSNFYFCQTFLWTINGLFCISIMTASCTFSCQRECLALGKAPHTFLGVKQILLKVWSCPNVLCRYLARHMTGRDTKWNEWQKKYMCLGSGDTVLVRIGIWTGLPRALLFIDCPFVCKKDVQIVDYIFTLICYKGIAVTLLDGGLYFQNVLWNKP